MTYFLIYLAIGLALYFLFVVFQLPYDVTVGDLFAVPLVAVIWPGLVFICLLVAIEKEGVLFTIGKKK